MNAFNYARDGVVENPRVHYTLHLIGAIHAIASSAGLNGVQVDHENRQDNSREGNPEKWRREHIVS